MTVRAKAVPAHTLVTSRAAGSMSRPSTPATGTAFPLRTPHHTPQLPLSRSVLDENAVTLDRPSELSAHPTAHSAHRNLSFPNRCRLLTQLGPPSTGKSRDMGCDLIQHYFYSRGDNIAAKEELHQTLREKTVFESRNSLTSKADRNFLLEAQSSRHCQKVTLAAGCLCAS